MATKVTINPNGLNFGDLPIVQKLQSWGKRMLVVAVIVLVLVLLFCYWWFHPPINIHSSATWSFVAIFVLLPIWLVLQLRRVSYQRGTKHVVQNPKKAQLFSRLALIPVAVIAAWAIGTLISMPIFNAHRYATILETTEDDFTTDIKEVNYSQIPVIDRDSAALLGNRTMGAIPEYVSQFEISSLYSQINYQGSPVRVSPLGYADIFKWFTNRTDGIPAYVLVNMTTQDTQIIKDKGAIHYSQSEPLFRNIDRYVQLQYPFYMFDQLAFEIDDDGKPWWICPVQDYTIGLFGGKTISRVVLVDATTGECTDLPVEECPQWVDRAYPADLLVQQYNWSGAYSGGWWNSWIGQAGVVQTTPGTDGQLGYNYIAKDDDVWVYTGVTSATADNSIVGFVLVNQRTAESHFYSVAGATEESAMSSAEGQVQQMRYQATFPLLINVGGQPTYFMALKDDAGLVKQYAMLDIQRYQNVATADTVANTQAAYKKLLATNGVEVEEDVAVEDAPDIEANGVIATITPTVIDGNSHFYVLLEDDERIYDFALPEQVDIIRLSAGDTISFKYEEPETPGAVCPVVEIVSYSTTQQ